MKLQSRNANLVDGYISTAASMQRSSTSGRKNIVDRHIELVDRHNHLKQLTAYIVFFALVNLILLIGLSLSCIL